MGSVGYLGPEGTFTEQAAQVYLQKSSQEGYTLEPWPSIAELLEGVKSDRIRHAVVPIENSIEGSISLTLDFLAEEKDLFIQGEVVLAICHQLMSKGHVLEDVDTVMSIAPALAQCRQFLSSRLPKAVIRNTDSTAEAAKLVANGPANWAAVGSEQAAKRYGLNILARDIQDREKNQTRFVVIGKVPLLPTGQDKTSLVCSLPQDRPGGLYSILWEFAEAHINLTKIESRPTKKVLGDYLFFIDCEGHCQDPILKEVLSKLEKKTCFIKILGSYPKAIGGGEAW